MIKTGYHISNARIQTVDHSKLAAGMFWLADRNEPELMEGAALQPGQPRYVHQVRYDATNAATRAQYDNHYLDALLNQGYTCVALEDCAAIIDFKSIISIEVL